MAELTKEGLIAQAEGNITMLRASLEHVKDPFERDDIAADLRLAEIALAALTAGVEQEPVAYIDPFTFKNFATYRTGETDNNRMGREWVWTKPDAGLIPLYAAPQLPQPVEPEITSEELDDELLEQLIDFRRNTLNHHRKEGNKVQAVMHGVVLRAMLELQERRAAMLQGNHRDLTHPVDSQVAAYEKIMEQAMPDGWVAVPVEPTEDMVIAGFEAEPDESFSEEKDWLAYEAMSGCQQAARRAKLCWHAMIAAAPQQEADNG